MGSLRFLSTFLIGLFGYFGLAKLGLEIAHIHLHISAVWPATGFAFLIFRHRGLSGLLGISVASFLVNFMQGHSWISAPLIASGTALEIYFAVKVYNSFSKLKNESPFHLRITRLITCAVIPALIAATIGSVAISLTGVMRPEEILFSIFVWAVGDSLGIFVVVPFTYSVFNWWKNTTRDKALDLFLIVAVTSMSGLGLWFFSNTILSDYLIFIFLIFLLVIGTRFHPILAYAAALAFYVVGIITGRVGSGLYLSSSPSISLIYLQVAFASISLTLVLIEDFYRKKVSQLPILLLILFWVIAGLSYGGLLEIIRTQKTITVREKFQIAERNLLARIDVYSSALQTMASHLASNREKCVSDWEGFIYDSKLISNFPGIMGVGIIHQIPRSKLKSWLKNNINECASPIKQINEIPNVKYIYPDEALIITHIAPLLPNIVALGVDVSTEQRRYESLIKAKDTGEVVISPPIHLVQDKKLEPSFLYYVPVYKNKKFIAWVYTPAVWSKFLNQAVKDLPSGIGYRLFSTYDGRDELLYQSHSFNAKQAFTQIGLVKIADKHFRIEWFSDPMMINPKDWLSIWVAFLLAGLAILLAIIAANMEQLTQRANAIAQQKSEALVSSAKLATLGELSSSIAHEINNPLGIINGLLEIVRIEIVENKASASELLPLHKRLTFTADRIGRIVNSMQILARDGSQHAIEKICLSAPVAVCTELVIEKFKNANIDLRINLDPLAYVMGSESEIAQVIANLLNNAFDAIKGTSNAWVEIESKREGRKVYLTVTDSGFGILPEIAHKIMQPWFTTKNFNQGSGLGLSISLKIMQTHKGTLELDTKSHHTRFMMSFPAA
jgi:signal transduction histidine kinase/integral membrane sensor domain MASE1